MSSNRVASLNVHLTERMTYPYQSFANFADTAHSPIEDEAIQGLGLIASVRGVYYGSSPLGKLLTQVYPNKSSRVDTKELVVAKVVQN